MSLPHALAQRTLDSILQTHPDLSETHAQILGDNVGTLRVFHGTQVAKVVYIGLVVPQFQLDSHMVFAFTPAESAVPHFTLDSVYGGAYYAFHLDLIPRMDLAPNLSYIDAAFHPLTEVFEKTSAMEGLSKAAISPRQHAIMSPWMLVHRATEEAFKAIDDTVDAYRSHWSSLLHQGIAVEGTDLAARDAAVRHNIFSPEVDPVWAQVARLLGQAKSDELRAELTNND